MGTKEASASRSPKPHPKLYSAQGTKMDPRVEGRVQGTGLGFKGLGFQGYRARNYIACLYVYISRYIMY